MQPLTDDQLTRITQLAALGNPPEHIAADLQIPDVEEFKKNGKVKAALKRGAAAFKAREKDWYPRPEDLATIESYFARSLSYREVARLIGTTEKNLRARVSDTPLLAAAVERGEANRNEKLADVAWKLGTDETLMARNPGLLIFMLKQHLGWSDKQEVKHSGNVTITAQLAPVKRVATDKVPALVDKELKRIGREAPTATATTDESEPAIVDVIPLPMPTAEPVPVIAPDPPKPQKYRLVSN